MLIGKTPTGVFSLARENSFRLLLCTNAADAKNKQKNQLHSLPIVLAVLKRH